jgi:hypothetical protein
VNLFRVIGSCLGVSAASSVMSWRMQVSAGSDDFDKVYFEGSSLLDAVESSLVVLAIFAVIVVVTAVINARSAHEAV